MRILLLAVVLALGVLGCGTSKPPEAPTSASMADPKGTGVASLAPELDASADARITIDVAGIRANPVLARLLAERDRDPVASAMVAKLDRVDVRASFPAEGPPAIVLIAWGKLPKDPHAEAALSAAFEEGTALASGVKEYRARAGDVPAHVFVVNDGVWVVTSGSTTDRIRQHFVASSAPPAAPSGGDLLHLRANGTALARAPHANEALGNVESMEISLGAKTLRAAAKFKDVEAAKNAAGQVRALSALLTLAMAAHKDCKAFEKIAIDVKNDGKDVVVELKGIDEAMAVWDPGACGRASHADMPSSKPHPAREPKRKPTKP